VNANTFTFATTLGDRGPSVASIAQMWNPAISSITGSGTTATVTTATAHHLTRFLQLYIFVGSVSPATTARPRVA
jgi:hypothetical protein